MSDLNFGDHTNRNIVKNPLLSTAVIGLSLEELNQRAVLLPAAPPPSLVTGQDITSQQTRTQFENANHPHQPSVTNISKQPPNLTHDPPKTTETFDVNEYFARLEGTRYVSAPINAEIPDKEVEEQNLEEVNLNEVSPDNSYHQSITSDIAQNFSQLPNVLPQMASAVFSSFSNMLNITKKEVADVQSYGDEGFKQVDFNADDFIGEVVKKEVAPPLKEPPTGSPANTYRITTKKKAYAHIPGLSSNPPMATQNNPLNPPPSQINYNYYSPNVVHSNIPETSQDFLEEKTKNSNVIGFCGDGKVVNIFDRNQTNLMNALGANYDANFDKSQINANVFDVHQTNTLEHKKPTKNVNEITMPTEVTYGQPQQVVTQDTTNYNIFQPPQQLIPSSGLVVDNATAILKPPITSDFNLNANSPIIPPPTMFSSPPKSETSNVSRSILPPSVAKRLGRNQPVPRNTSAMPAIEANIFVPPELAAANPIDESTTNLPPPTVVPGFSETNVMHAPLSVYAPQNIPTTFAHNIFTPTLDCNSKFESSSSSAFATTSVQNILEAGSHMQTYDAVAASSANNPMSINASENLSASHGSVSNQNLVSPNVHAPLLFDPAKIIQPIVEPPKPVPDPPKLSATGVNFRLNKKRPQYYAGPIDGVGAVSNNFKPIIGPTETSASQSAFYGSLFTPPVNFTGESKTENQYVPPAISPSYHHITPTIAHQRDLNEPTAYDYRYENKKTQNTVCNPLDYSKQTTEFHDEPKTDSKGFGIIGSLKSKLSSIDINKIQNTVTTFFDPAYNDGVKKEASNDSEPYQSQNYPSYAGDNSSLEIFVPSTDTKPGNQQTEYPSNVDYQSQYSTYFGNTDYTNQGHYKTQSATYQDQQFYTGSYYTEDLSDSNSSNVASAYINVGSTIRLDCSAPDRVIDQQIYLPDNALTQNTEMCDEQKYTNDYEKTEFGSQMQNKPLHSNVPSQSNIDDNNQLTEANDDPVKQPETLPPNKYGQVEMMNPIDFFNQHHDVTESLNIGHSQPVLDSDCARGIFSSNSSDINKQGNGNDKDLSTFYDTDNMKPSLTASGFFNKNEGENIALAITNTAQKTDTSPLEKKPHNEASLTLSKNCGVPSNLSVSDFLMQSVKESALNSETESFDIVSPFNISSTPLLNLSTMLAEKSSSHDAEDFLGLRDSKIVEPTDDQNEDIPMVAISDTVKEIDICETCREVNKEDENDANDIDLTTQLIQNIISPIQLLNPVEVPLPEATAVINDGAVFDADQCAQISLMTASTIETIQSNSVTSLINDDDIEQFDKTLKITSSLIGNDSETSYGWKQSEQLNQVDVKVNQEHAYSFQPDTSRIGFYGDNSLFFDQIPSKSAVELKPGLNLNTLDNNTVIKQPSAPNIEDIDDNTSDVTGGIDVQLIEQDAKTDFEEFIVEPSPTDDDDKTIIEERETSENAIKDIGSFTERVEEFKSHEVSSEDVFASNTSINSQQNVLRTEFTSPTTIASYFDTGNYAADSHYRKSMTSPSSASSFEVGSPKQNSAMPSVTASNVKILPSIIQPSEKDDNSIQVPLTKGIFTLESLSDQRIDSTEALTKRSQDMPISTSAYTNLYSNEMLNEFPDLIRDTKQSGDCLPHYNMPDFSAHITANPNTQVPVVSTITVPTGNIETIENIIAGHMTSKVSKLEPRAGITQQTLEDPMAFFQTEPKPDQSEESCSRLASYFSSPPKCEQSKSFFEISQSQNHLRQNPGTSKKEYKTVYELSQANANLNVQRPIELNETNDKVETPFHLFKELTSIDNYTPTEDQTTRQINYFTVEYDLVKRNFNRDNNIGEPNASGCSKSIDSNNKKQKDENKDFSKESNHPMFIAGECSKLCINKNKKTKTEDCVNNKTQTPVNKSEKSTNNIKLNSNETCYLDVIKACKKCNCLYSEHLEKVRLDNQKVFKIKQAMDTERGANSNAEVMAAENVTEHLTMDYEFVGDGKEDEKFSVVTDENRQSSEYVPVKYHWFYRVDTQGKSLWRGFCTRDSQALEEAHNSPSLDENTLVPTDGGRFDVNVMGRLRLAVYWDEKPTNVRRCSWFFKGTTDARYVPYTEAIAEKLEEEYRKGVTTGSWHRRLVLSNNEAVIMHTPSVCVHLPHSSSADQTSPRQSTMRPRVVRRGIDDSEIEDTEPSRIDHLLLLCHGVGSACDMKFRSVEQVVDDFRATSVQLIQAHYKSSYENGDIGRIEVLPIAWHSSLHSGESGVDKRLSMITLDSIPLVRSFTNDAVLDVLFYTSPKYCQTIIDTVCAEMNRIYSLFMARNRNFYGGVSVGGHSLGSVILYDLLCHQVPREPVCTHTESPSSHRHMNPGTAGTGQPQVAYPQLVFHPCAFYALGSPIAIFECIRGVDLLGEDFTLPTCPKFYNIFHPYDPIAYRIEPLLNPRFKKIPPLLIPHHKGRKRMHLELKETMARVGADLKQKLMESIKSTWSHMWKTDAGTQQRLEKVVEEEIEKEALNQEETGDVTVVIDEVQKGETLIAGRLNSGRRVDHVLQEAPLEMINEYLFAMSSHVCYWESEDTMLLILREVYDALGIQPDSTVPQQTMTVQRETGLRNEIINPGTKDLPSTSSSSA